MAAATAVHLCESQLLFLDTFSHDPSEGLNLDLVQFSQPVCVSEVRIIPLGAKVELKLPGGTRLGATNPSKFHIEVFINNLGQKKAAVFQKVGSLEYNEQNIQALIKNPIPTDGVILKGWYTALTVAVFGYSAESLKNVRVPDQGAEKTQPEEVKGSMPLEVQPEVKLESPQPAQTSVSKEALQEQLYGVLSAEEEVQSDDQEMYSEEDVLAGDIITTDMTGYDEGYEPFAALTSFNPYQFEVTQLSTFVCPTTTSYEEEKMRCAELDTVNSAAVRILEVINRYEQEPHHGSWIEAVEDLCGVLASGIASLNADQARHDRVVSTLVAWAVKMLDLDAAKAQPETPMKVRHLKIGIRLVISMATLDEPITMQLLMQGVLDRLFSLFSSPHVAASLRLLIIRAMDTLTFLPCGISWFVGLTGPNERPSGYQRLLDMATSKQATRIMVAISTLMRKLHVYELLRNLQSAANRVADRTVSYIKVDTQEPKNQAADGNQDPISGDQSSTVQGCIPAAVIAYPESLSEQEVDVIIDCLEEITAVLGNASLTIAQPSARTLPAQKQFSLRLQPADPYPALYQMLESSNVVEILYVLLSSPMTCSHSQLFMAARDLIQQFMRTQQGLLFLSTHMEMINGIIRTLLQTAEFERDPESEENAAQALGLQLVYHLQTLQFVDQLKEFWLRQDSEPIDDVEALGILHAMLGLSVIPVGREALARVLSWDLDPLIAFISNTGDEELDGKQKLCTTTKYFNDLMQIVLMQCDDVSYMEKYAPRLIAFTSYDDEKKVLAEVREWLEPYKDIGLIDYKCVPALAKSFHSYVEQLPKIEVGLVTCLRLMKYLAIAPSLQDTEGFVTEQLSYTRVLIDLYGSQCCDGFLKILDKMSEKQLSWQRGLSASTDRDLLLAILQPCVTLIKAILGQLIEIRGVHFKDVSMLHTLFRTFTLICNIPAGGAFAVTVTEIQKDIMEILMAFTQPTVNGSDADISSAMASSLWTRMLKELLKYTLSHPYNYLSGVLMLSELLPIPLPIQCPSAMAEEETKLIINSRKIWSAHMLPLSEDLDLFITTLAGSGCLHLQLAFRRVCWQLTDLASHFALFVTRCLLRGLSDSFTTVAVEVPPVACDGAAAVSTESELPPKLTEAGPITSNTVGVLSYLSQQPPVKAALLHFLRIKSDENSQYELTFSKLLLTLNVVSERSTHNQCQENIVALLQSLCDVQISLCEYSDDVDVNIQLANELPDLESLNKITASFMEHIGNYDHCYTSILLSLRTLVMFTDYNFTFRCLKSALLQDTKSLFNLLTRVNNTFSKDSSDCISTLSTALELLRLLVCTDEEVQPARSLTLSAKELSQVLNWNAQSHPLDDLEKLLVDLVEESLEGIVTNITSITQILRSEQVAEQVAAPDMTGLASAELSQEQAVELPAPVSIQDLFNRRAVYILAEPDDEKLSAAYWLTNLMADDSDVEDQDERVSVDLIQLCEAYLKDFNLETEISKTDADLDSMSKVAVSRTRKQEVLVLGQEGKKFTAPMRGLGVMRRGQARGRGAQAGRGDMFRNRLPNTSRPPSMHVDDFVKMEASGSGEEKPPERIQFPPREPSRGGFDRGRGRMRFSTAPEGFKPNFRGGFRGGRGVLRGGRGNTFYDRGRGRFAENMRFAGGRGSTMLDTRTDRRNFSPPHGTRHTSPMENRRRPGSLRPASMGLPQQSTLRGGRGNYYQRDKDTRMMPPPASDSRDRERSRHYRSYTK